MKDMQIPQKPNNEYTREDNAIFFDRLPECVKREDKYVDYLLMEKFYTICLDAKDVKSTLDKFVNTLKENDIEDKRIALLLQSISMNYGVLNMIYEELKDIDEMKKVYYMLYNKSEEL